MMNKEMDDVALRPTGHMERFNILRNHVKFYNKFGVTATYTAPRSLLASNSLEQVVYAALREVLNHHPIMGVTVQDEATVEPKWIRLPTIDFRRVVEVVNADLEASYDSWVTDALRAPFVVVDDLPMWRVVVGKGQDVETFAVGFFCHHAIADGVSAGAFQLTFLDALNGLIDGKIETISNIEEEAVVSVPKLPLVPNMEMKTALPVGIFFALKKIISTYVWSTEDPLNWSGSPISAEAPRPPIGNLKSFSLSSDVVGGLLRRCRKENTSMTALLTILVARKLAVMYPSYTHFTSNIPFSLRKFTGHSNRDMGCYVSNLTPCFSSEERPLWGYISCRSNSGDKPEQDDEKLWEGARASKKQIDEGTATTSNQNVGLLKFVSDYNKFFYGMFGKKREHAFEVTNIGVLDGGVRGEAGEQKACFDRVLFATAQCTYADPYIFSIASAKNGIMTVSLSWATGVLDDDEAVEMIDWLEGALKGLSEA
ncbi:putative alcohol acetyltransferase FCK4 [Lachnellula arida]|uniref:Putative alcohol acetyltransferase FCK4 n=1 Tax=Lachnellula arida TaxID=1316785 RepID=A0A8T9BF34_9HELO|nr:putative alcohol acetyltransferase FCK4 [Lachnellula arida]